MIVSKWFKETTYGQLVLEVSDNATPEEIENALQEHANSVDINWDGDMEISDSGQGYEILEEHTGFERD